MPLATGTQLGVYEILSPLGVGGMGEVYRARDTKLDREVAIKVLPEELSRDRERLVRFEREAKLLAGLNHSNIATLYGLETIDDRQLLIMELVEGETLAERIARGPIPVDEAIALFVQIAEGLGAAHDKGVVHRDLKPANIKITPDGKVKILDFGLAKAFDEDEAPGQGTSQSPTLTKGTAMGVILGTAPYMSPEQARGKAVDKRTDIWAFGCCLFEALTGSKTFDGETVTDTLAAIVKNEPTWERLPAETPGELKVLLRRCLDKDVNRRVRDAWDLRLQMEGGVEEVTLVAAPVKHRLSLVSWIVAASLGGLAVLGLSSRAPGRTTTTRLEIHLDDHTLELQRGVTVPIALSPDGNSLVYVGSVGPSAQLFERRLNEFDARPISNTEGAYRPFFSPDGEWIGFNTGGERPILEKVSLQGGGRFTIAESAGGGSWRDDGTIVYGSVPGFELTSVSETGGEPVVLTQVADQGVQRHESPETLPDGAGVLFTIGAEGTSRIAVLSGRTGDWKVLDVLGEGGSPKYLSTGHVIYVQRGTIVAAPFDLSRLEVTGTPTPVVSGVASRVNQARVDSMYAVSNAGHLAYVPGATTIQRQLVWVDRYGRQTPARDELGPYEYPVVSPGGTSIAYTKHNLNHDSWAYDLERGTEARLSVGGGTGNVWTPDGRALALGLGGGLDNIFLKDADGGGAAELLVDKSSELDYLRPGAWTPDGRKLLYIAVYLDGNNDIRIREQNGETTAFVATAFNEYQPALSPGGRFVAYVSDESGVEEVYVQPFPGLEWRRLVSRDGGREPRWSPRGDELYYRKDRAVLAVSVRAEPEFAAGNPELLFEGDFHVSPGGTNNPDYDISPDGERFLMIRSEEPYRRIRIVLNWFDELERLVPIP